MDFNGEIGKHTVRHGKRLYWLDMAKAFMLLPAILEHTEAGFLWDWCDSMVLAVFWMGAGYVSRPDFNIISKAKSLLLPYFVMSALCLIFLWTYVNEPFNQLQIEGVLYGRFKLWRDPLSELNPKLMTDMNSVLWYLPSFFLSYIVFKLLIKVKGLARNVGAIVICVVASWLMGMLPILLPWSLDTAPAFGSLIYCGRLIRLSEILKKRAVLLTFAGVVGYTVFNQLAGVTNISIGYFGNSIFYWYAAALCGATAFLALCSLCGESALSRGVAWFNRGALFIFGMQLVFTRLAQDFYAPYGIESWKIRAVIVLIFCFAGGKILSVLYSFAPRRRQPTSNPL